MPWTFSHPIAVIPVQRIFGSSINFPALVVGSISPDFGYYGKQFAIATDAHTLSGLFLLCLPLGLAVLAGFYGLREALCFLLPDPHRTVLMPLASVRPVLNSRSIGVAAVSIALGAATHVAWDSLTHSGGWTVARFPFLSAPLFGSIPLSYILQQASTLIGAAGLLFLYLRWLHRQPYRAPSGMGSDQWRYWGLFAMVVLAAIIAAPFALEMAAHYRGYLAFRVFLFRFAIYSTMAFLPLYVLGSVLAFWKFRHRG